MAPLSRCSSCSWGARRNHSAPGEAVTDDAASAGPADAVPVERRNMPLTVKPF